MADVEDAMWYYRAVHALVADCLERKLPKDAAAELLDAGCGSGGLIRRISGNHSRWRWRGVDFSPLACALARQRCPAEISEGSITALPYRDNQFDAIVSIDVLSHIEKPRDGLSEFYRCLRPGGIVVINVPAYRWLWSYHDVAVQGEWRFNRREMTVLTQRAGFTILQSTYRNMLPFPLVVLRRKLFPPSDPTSDVRLYPGPIEAGFNALMAIEHAWLHRGGSLPFGSSVLIVAKKNQTAL